MKTSVKVMKNGESFHISMENMNNSLRYIRPINNERVKHVKII